MDNSTVKNPTTNSTENSGGSTLRRHCTFWSVCCLGAVVWCVVLPALGRVGTTPSADYDKLGIDPAAFFYTDLEVVDDALDRLDRFNKQHPQALWNPTFAEADEPLENNSK